MASILQDIGHGIASFDPASLSDDAIARGRAAMMDTVGVTLAGAGETACRIQRDIAMAWPAAGDSLVLGTNLRTSPLTATLLNGVAAHALDYDDGNSTLAGHPSVMLVPPLLALAEDRGKSGLDLLVAYVAGMETMIAVARGVNLQHYERGWHPTSTLGIFGTAAACAQMLGLDAPRTTTSLAICASMASGVKANFGTMTKALHVGLGGHNGLYAALLAERGFTANAAALEADQGFLKVYNGDGAYDAAAIVSSWSAPYAIETLATNRKQHPCCGSTSPAAAAAASLFETLRPHEGEIRSVEILTHRRRLPHTDRPDPPTAIAAKFSIQYVVARVLLQGDLSLADFEGDAHLDPAIRRLMARTTAAADPSMTQNEPDEFRARVIVTMKTGERHVAHSSRPSPNPGRLRTKFEDCAGRVLPRARVLAVMDVIDNLQQLSSITQLTRLMDPLSQSALI